MINMIYQFRGSVRSDLIQIKYFVDSRRDELNRYIDDDNTLFEIRLIVNELIINGACHGNNLARDKSVYLHLDLSDDMIKIRVIDEGDGIKYAISQYNPEEMLPTGRGLLLVEGLADRFEYIDNTVLAIINF